MILVKWWHILNKLKKLMLLKLNIAAGVNTLEYAAKVYLFSLK